MHQRVASIAVLLCFLFAVGTASADGDPASDVLYTQNTYLPFDRPPASAASALNKVIAAAYAKKYRIKVAVIGSQSDLGSVPELFNKPTQYARFLGTELESFYIGPLLIVMPSGFGVFDGGRSTLAEQRVLAQLSVQGSDSGTLTHAAATAVQRFLATGALRSKDIRAPFAYAISATVHRGKVARLQVAVSDDSGWSRVTVQVLANAGGTLATLKRPLLPVNPLKLVSTSWKVPVKLPSRKLRLCVTAIDPSGNRSPRNCVLLTVT